MNEAGLPEKWRRRYQRGGHRCVGNDAEKEGKAKKRDQRITLKNISGSFVVLVVGLFSSLIVFISEFIIRRRESAVVNLPSVAIPIKTAVEDAGKNQSKVIRTIDPPPAPPVQELNKDKVQSIDHRPGLVNRLKEPRTNVRPSKGKDEISSPAKQQFQHQPTTTSAINRLSGRGKNYLTNKEPDNESSDYVIVISDDHHRADKEMSVGESLNVVNFVSLDLK